MRAVQLHGAHDMRQPFAALQACTCAPHGGGITDLPTAGMIATYSAAMLSAAEYDLHALSAVRALL